MDFPCIIPNIHINHSNINISISFIHFMLCQKRWNQTQQDLFRQNLFISFKSIESHCFFSSVSAHFKDSKQELEHRFKATLQNFLLTSRRKLKHFFDLLLKNI